jgi:hypothetical protein
VVYFRLGAMDPQKLAAAEAGDMSAVAISLLQQCDGRRRLS